MYVFVGSTCKIIKTATIPQKKSEKKSWYFTKSKGEFKQHNLMLFQIFFYLLLEKCVEDLAVKYSEKNMDFDRMYRTPT